MEEVYNNLALCNLDAERKVIGCCIDMKNGIPLEELSDDDFTEIPAKLCSKIIKAIVAEKLVLDIVSFKIKAEKLYPDQTMKLIEYFMACMDYVIVSVNYKYYVNIVKNCATRRRAIELMQECISDLNDINIDYSEVSEKLTAGLKQISVQGEKWQSLFEVINKTFDHLSKIANGEYKPIKSGLWNIDKSIGGFYEGELTVIGARPGVGKSAFAGFVALKAAAEGKKVCICSREMSDIQYGQRIIANIGDIDANNFRINNLSNDKIWENIAEAISKSSNLDLSFIFSIKNIEDLKITITKKVEKGECDLLIVDYLQLMGTKKKFDMDHLRVGYISKILKDMSIDLNIPIIALAQVRRNTQGIKTKMPELDDLKDSGSIEQDADGVILLHRPMDAGDKYLKGKIKSLYEAYEKYGGKKQVLIVNIAKQRQGKTGAIFLLFDPAKMHFEPVEP